MKTNDKVRVRFLLDEDKSVFAYFPYDNYNRYLYGNDIKTSYAHLGQHSACDKGYAAKCKKATPEQYEPLKQELESIGYSLNILN